MENIDDSDVEIDTKLLMEHFSAKKSKKKEPPSESKAAPASPKAVTIVDGKKQQNAGIVISRLKMSIDEFRVILNMDERLLTQDKVAMLINIAPTPEETGALQAFDGDSGMLGKYKLLLELTMITHFWRSSCNALKSSTPSTSRHRSLRA